MKFIFYIFTFLVFTFNSTPAFASDIMYSLLTAAQQADIRGDYKTAFKLHLPRARHGDYSSQAVIGKRYEKGKGVPRNFVEAYAWYGIAATSNAWEAQRDIPELMTTTRAMAEKERKLIAEKMTPEEIANGERLIAAFRPVDELKITPDMIPLLSEKFKDPQKLQTAIQQDAEETRRQREKEELYPTPKSEEEAILAELEADEAALSPAEKRDREKEEAESIASEQRQRVEVAKQSKDFKKKSPQNIQQENECFGDIAEMQKKHQDVSRFRRDLEAYRKKAETGDPAAQRNLADKYQYHCGVRGEAEAIKWWRKAAEQGDAEAQVSLGQAYAFDLLKTNKEGVKWLRRAAERSYPNSYDYARIASRAEWVLSRVFTEGRIVKQDYAQAYYWYNRSEDNASYGGAEGYARGTDVYFPLHLSVNEMKAIRERINKEPHSLLSRAKGGDPAAQYGWGLKLYHGWEVPKDRVAAIEWLRKAAMQNHKAAQKDLGLAYASMQDGVPYDRIEAVFWLQLGGFNGIIYDEEFARLTPTQREAIQKRIYEHRKMWDSKKTGGSPLQ